MITNGLWTLLASFTNCLTYLNIFYKGHRRYWPINKCKVKNIWNDCKSWSLLVVNKLLLVLLLFLLLIGIAQRYYTSISLIILSCNCYNILQSSYSNVLFLIMWIIFDQSVQDRSMIKGMIILGLRLGVWISFNSKIMFMVASSTLIM